VINGYDVMSGYVKGHILMNPLTPVHRIRCAPMFKIPSIKTAKSRSLNAEESMREFMIISLTTPHKITRNSLIRVLFALIINISQSWAGV
jgi:hypothetical protein